MDLTKLTNQRRKIKDQLPLLKDQLLFAIPEELYDIEPGQMFFFVPRDGINKTLSKTLSEIFRFCTFLKKSDIRISIIPTDNELLLENNIACRNSKEILSPYKVVIGPWETIVGIIAEYYNFNLERLWAKVPSMGPTMRFSVLFDHPVVVSIDPQNRPVKKSADISGDFPNGFGLEWLKKRPETDKEKEDVIANREQKIKKILWECAYLGIDIDIKSIADEVEASKSEASDYVLSLKMDPKEDSGLIDCKIYVKEDKELVLTPIRKAVYLTFLSLKDGQVIESATPAFTQIIQKIYRLLPDKEQKDEEKNGARGILAAQYIQSKTLRGYMSDVNSAIAKLIPNGLAAIEFSIEGEKDGAFKVMRSTPEIRKQIISAFNL